MRRPAPTFDTVLVANRGEIACRVIAAARDAGYRTVAVHSDADAAAPHVALADEAVRLGPAPARLSYLDIDAVLAAAAATGADAIHPGYGFLAENAAFARACADAGVTFIGPPAEAIALMGDKAAAKRRMAAAGVPLLPGYQGVEADDARLLAEAERVGMPLMVKAAAGGGGKGMRLVTDLAELPGALVAARREASAAFGDDTLILERALRSPRHIEIQVIADAHGRTIALGERDCSVQRRHQKVVEEAPSPALDAATREAMQAAAVAAAASVGYVGAGTVEFLWQPTDRSGEFFFLEMNTRLQVEHPVTELVTGVDLVDWQLRIARGEALTITQDDVRMDGHAIEARLYAEDPANGYLPQTGPIVEWRPPGGTGVRVDAGVRSGQTVTADYDPMLAKIIAHGRDREEARRRLVRAVERTVILGPRTNRAWLATLLDHPDFAAGHATTAFLQEHDIAAPGPTDAQIAMVAARLQMQWMVAAEARSPGLASWTSSPLPAIPQRLRHAGGEVEVFLTRTPDGLTVRLGEDENALALLVTGPPERLRVDGHAAPMHARVRLGGDSRRILAAFPRCDVDATDVLLEAVDAAGAGGAGVLLAPMHGAVIAVQAEVGDHVSADQPLVIMEAMKMEHVVVADVVGVVAEIVAVGAQVGDGEVVARIDPAPVPHCDP